MIALSVTPEGDLSIKVLTHRKKKEAPPLTLSNLSMEQYIINTDASTVHVIRSCEFNHIKIQDTTCISHLNILPQKTASSPMTFGYSNHYTSFPLDSIPCNAGSALYDINVVVIRCLTVWAEKIMPAN